MFRTASRTALRLLALPLAALSLAWLVFSVGRGQPPASQKTAAAKQAAAADASRYLGVVACARCHRQPTSEDHDAKITDFVSLTEYETWSAEDKHSRAYEVLLDDRTKGMEKLLGIDAKASASCLACHAVSSPADRRDQSFRIERGVSCEACHGPSSNWVDPHWKSGWRSTDAAQKQSLGMVDVRDPVRRTELCLSCHLGNVAEGKVVTHEMYAAGHPPLPSFEIESFIGVMPAHWRALSKKPADVQEQFHYKAQPLERTRQVLSGGLVALRTELTMLGEAAAGKPEAWPELSLYDCRACHHDLRAPAWRQRRGYEGKPGRPAIHAWSRALAQLGFAEAGDAGGTATLKGVFTSLDEQPFGNRQTIGTATGAAIQQLDKALARLHAKELSAADSRRLAKEVLRLAGAQMPDYESARQYAWALQVIYSELEPKSAADAQVQEIFTLWDEQLALKLPIGRDKPAAGVEPAALDTANSFVPTTFQAQVKKLAAQIGD